MFEVNSPASIKYIGISRLRGHLFMLIHPMVNTEKNKAYRNTSDPFIPAKK